MGKKKKKDFKKKTLTGTPDEHYPSVFHLFAIPNGAWLSDHYTWGKKKISLLSEPQNLNQESNKKISQSGHLFNIVEHKMAKIKSQNISSHCPQNNSYIIAILCLFVSHFTACWYQLLAANRFYWKVFVPSQFRHNC